MSNFISEGESLGSHEHAHPHSQTEATSSKGAYHAHGGGALREVHSLAVLRAVDACVEALQIAGAAGAQSLHCLRRQRGLLGCM